MQSRLRTSRMIKPITKMTLNERFDAKWMPEPNSGCWLWIAGMQGAYGWFWNRSPELAHRVAWTFHRGDIPEGSHVLHRCDTPLCVNPDHLFLGTQVDNNRDREAKGRGRPLRGEKHGMAKLTEAQVREIRRSDETNPVLARRLGLSREHTWRVRRGANWKYLAWSP